MANRSRTAEAATARVASITSPTLAGLVLAASIAVAAVAMTAIRAPAPGASAVAGGGGGLARVVASSPPRVVDGIPDVPWLSERGDGGWLYGRGATSTPRVLPAGETGLAIGELGLASVVPADGRSTVRLRDPDTGALVGEVAMPMWVSAGAWTKAGLVVTGYRDSSMRADGGLLLMAAPDLSLTTFVPGGAFPKALGSPAARGEVVVSPSGRLAASNVCGVRLCDAQVVDVETGQVFRPIRSAEGFLRVATDDAIVTTDGDSAWISARRIDDGAEAWRLRDSVLLDPLAAADGSVVAVVGSRTPGWAVAAIDGRGRRRDLTRRVAADQPMPRIWREVSTPTRAVVGREPFDVALHGLGDRSVEILRVAQPLRATELPAGAPSARPETVR